MRRLTETLVAVGIIAGMLSATICRREQFYGSWGVEPTAEVLTAWQAYLAIVDRPDKYRTQCRKELVRASAAKTIFDSKSGQNVRAVKVEYIDHFPDDPQLQPRRSAIVIGYNGGSIVRWYYEGKGPKEYREAF